MRDKESALTSREWEKSLSVLVERELKAFQGLLPKLLPTEKGKYIALYEGKEIDRDEDEFELAERVSRRSLPRPVLVRQITEEYPKEFIESPEEIA